MKFEKEPSVEINEKPPILYRAFTVDPELLTVELLDKDLEPGMISKEDPTKIADGNELGVYMSTNQHMVETAYAHTPLGLHLKTPQYNNRGLIMDYITLPQCGVVVEVVTENLPIRKPEISKVLQGVYNNGFEGDEWIADQVPSGQFKVVRLILSSETYDKEKFIINVDGSKKEDLEKAIDSIKTEFERRKKKAMEYKNFIEELEPSVRTNELLIKIKWKEFEKNLKKDTES